VQLLTYSVALVRKRTIPTERQPLVGEVSANFISEKVIRVNILPKLQRSCNQCIRFVNFKVSPINTKFDLNLLINCGAETFLFKTKNLPPYYAF
jgi:hypothetical protein